VLRLLIQSLKVVVIAVVALLVLAGAQQVWESLSGRPTATPTAVAIRIQPGDSPAEITKKLEDAKVIRNGAIFRVLVRVRNVGGKFVAGEHRLITGMSMNQIIDVLTAPPRFDVAEVTITFPEGQRLEQYAAALKKAGLVATEDDFIKATKEDYDFEFLRFRPPGVGLEGYLFPDTYRFTVGMKPNEIVRRMLENFDRRITGEMRAKAEAQPRNNLHRVMTLASIVEREAQSAEERRTIAGVYANRLDKEMPLQADPTVQYGIGSPAEWWPRGDALANALRQPGPYNTYLMPGLPPAPIASPGLASIQAALDPEKHEYLYFVAKGDDGTHAFARTLDEHNANVRRYQR
jgi:UPF0755 protein